MANNSHTFVAEDGRITANRHTTVLDNEILIKRHAASDSASTLSCTGKLSAASDSQYGIYR